jgi:hypothetical protein
MSWFIEHLHRDGSVLARVAVPPPDVPGAIASLRIGRALDNDVVLDDPHCAAHHARLDVGADGVARLADLGTRNGIIAGRNQRASVHEVTKDETYRLGHSLIRVRSSTWALAPERALSRRAVWPLALLCLALVLSHGAWDIWLKDVQEKSPPYFYALSALAAGICLWSAAYALFGRLISGVERFFSHLAIASVGYLSGVLILDLLEMLAFSSSWLWPLRITQPVIVMVAAMTVRFHLRLADPRHWHALRVALVVVAALAMVIPIAQEWVSHQRLTDVQTLKTIEYPSLRLAQPVTLDEFSAATGALKERADKARKNAEGDTDGGNFNNDFAP